MRMWWIAVVMAACYAPDAPTGIPCNASFECPLGQTCDRSVSPPTCGNGITGGGDAPEQPDGPAPADASDGGLGAWGPPVLVMQPVGNEDDPTLTGDLLDLYFNRGTSTILHATRSSPTAAWDQPVIVPELGLATTPELEPDGLTIYLGSDRVGTAGDLDIWISTRPTRADAWSLPVRVVELCTAVVDSNAAVTADHLHVVFARRGASGRGIEVFAASRATRADPFGTATTLDELGSTASDGDAMLTDDLLSVFFYSTREGAGDLYFATRANPNDPFGTPQPITELNTPDFVEQDPWISPDGRHLFFSSNRSGTLAIYESTR